MKIKLKIKLLILSTLLIINAQCNGKELDGILKGFVWEKRILLLIAKNKNDALINKVKIFFNLYRCENQDRNLKLISIIKSDLRALKIPKRFEDKFGIWLIGYDGLAKAYSENSSLLKNIHEIIDSMPIRQSEMFSKKLNCN